MSDTATVLAPSAGAQPSDAIGILFDADGLAAFRTQAWPHSVATWRLPADQLAAIFELAGFRSAQGALELYAAPVMVYGEVALEVTEGVSSRFLTSVATAQRCLAAGATIELDYFETRRARLRRFVERLRAQLGLSRDAMAKCVVYASTRSTGLKMHYDAYANFIVQLEGRKTWSLNSDDAIAAPSEHYDLGAPFPPAESADRLAELSEARVYAGARAVTLEPGDVLFVPRGVWHATAAGGSSLSLNFTFSQPTWADVALDQLRQRLVLDPAWRELATVDRAEAPVAESLKDRLLRAIGDAPDQAFRPRDEAPLDLYGEANAMFRELWRDGPP